MTVKKMMSVMVGLVAMGLVACGPAPVDGQFDGMERPDSYALDGDFDKADWDAMTQQYAAHGSDYEMHSNRGDVLLPGDTYWAGEYDWQDASSHFHRFYPRPGYEYTIEYEGYYQALTLGGWQRTCGFGSWIGLFDEKGNKIRDLNDKPMSATAPGQCSMTYTVSFRSHKDIWVGVGTDKIYANDDLLTHGEHAYRVKVTAEPLAACETLGAGSCETRGYCSYDQGACVPKVIELPEGQSCGDMSPESQCQDMEACSFGIGWYGGFCSTVPQPVEQAPAE